MNVPVSKKQQVKIINSEKLFHIMQEVLLRENSIDQDKEHFWVVGLANNNRLLYIELVSLGTINATLVEPMDVYSWALQKRCVKIMLVHNHPSGELLPSKADKDITDRMIQVGKIVDIEVLDHLIISIDDYVSFDNIGLMDELAESTAWVPNYILKEPLQKHAEKEAEKIANREAKKEKQLEIAKKMKEKGYDPDTIKELTGVAKKEIAKL